MSVYSSLRSDSYTAGPSDIRYLCYPRPDPPSWNQRFIGNRFRKLNCCLVTGRRNTCSFLTVKKLQTSVVFKIAVYLMISSTAVSYAVIWHRSYFICCNVQFSHYHSFKSSFHTEHSEQSTLHWLSFVSYNKTLMIRLNIILIANVLLVLTHDSRNLLSKILCDVICK